jgi:hypothetical protein
MLASALISVQVAPELAETGKLCPQQDLIITKFNQLLARLNSNIVARNASDQTSFAKQEKAIQDWLDIESEYRLAAGKAATSKEGAAYAQGQYEKWNALLTASKKRQGEEIKDAIPKKAEIDTERALIKELLALISTLQNSEVARSNNQAILQQFNQKVVFLHAYSHICFSSSWLLTLHLFLFAACRAQTAGQGRRWSQIGSGKFLNVPS